MALFTFSQRSEVAAGSVVSTLALVLRLRLIAFSSALVLWLLFTLIRLAFDGWDDLVFHSFAALLVGEGVALLSMIVPAFRAAPIAAVIHLVTTAAWVYALVQVGASWWHAGWKALGLPGA